MEDSIVKVEHLSHRYHIQWAIQDINFEIKEKGVLGLLGSNGAGKSTTMNIICGVLNQTEGEVYLNGYNLRTTYWFPPPKTSSLPGYHGGGISNLRRKPASHEHVRDSGRG